MTDLDLSTVLTSSPAIASLLETRLTELVNSLFDELNDIIDHGDVASKMTLMKQILPVLLKVKKDLEDEGASSAEEMFAQVREMISGMGGSMGAEPGHG